MRLKVVVVLLIIILFATIAGVLGTQYLRTESKNVSNVYQGSGTYIRFFGRDKAPDNVYMVRNSATYDDFRVDLGSYTAGTTVTAKAAFAISNEETFNISIRSLSISGSAADYFVVHFHKTSNIEAPTDGTAGIHNLEVWDGVDKHNPDDTSEFIWDLAAGNADTLNANGTAYAVDGPMSPSYAMYMDPAKEPDPRYCMYADDLHTDFVWVQVKVVSTIPAGSYTGFFKFSFKNIAPLYGTQYFKIELKYTLTITST